jgi:vacuolar-type H+-ATPase subunit H
MSSDRTVKRREIEDSTAARLAEIVAAAEQAAKRVIDEAEEEARTTLSDAHEEAERIVAERLAGLAELTDEVGAQAAELATRAEELRRALARAKAEIDAAEAFGGASPNGRREPDPEDDPAPTRRIPAGPDLEPGGRKPVGPALTVVGDAAAEEAVPETEPASEVTFAPDDDRLPPVRRNGSAWRNGDAERRRDPASAPDGDPEPAAEVDSPTPIGGSPAGARLLATQMAVSGSSRAEIESRLRNGFAITDTRSILDAILGPEG